MCYLICPICGENLVINAKEAFCKNNHHFDKAKQDYLNLLMKNSSAKKKHGDDKMMVGARYNFLSKGYYLKLAETVSEFVNRYVFGDAVILDVGCGEGYYSEVIYNKLTSVKKRCNMICLDISKEAIKNIGKRKFPKKAIVASSFKLPVLSNSVDIVISIFSPVAPEEFLRVLKPDGILLRVVPNEMHLYELKELIYDYPYKNPKVVQKLEYFRNVESFNLDYTIQISNNKDLEYLFKMTPYFYKTSVKDQQRINEVSCLDISLSFVILVDKPMCYERIDYNS